MTEFEKALEVCLHDLEHGASNVDECLRRHPGHALQLEPVLLTAAYLQHGREARPSAAFKARVRNKLIQGMQAHPPKTMTFSFMFVRPVVSLAIIVLALLITGTVYAQNALPGDLFYAWKLASENAWRAIATDPVGTDLALADRRVEELIAVRDHPALHMEALEAYFEVIARLESAMNPENETRILQVLEAQIEELNDAGIPVAQVDPYIPLPLDELLPAPSVTSTPIPEIPQVDPTLPAPTTGPTLVPELPQAVPTDLPDLVPTVQVPPDLIPTAEIPSLLP